MNLKDNVVFKTIRKLPKPHRTGLMIGSLLLGGLIMLPSDPVEASRHQESLVLDTGVRYPLELSVNDSPAVAFGEEDTQWQLYQVGAGDTLAKIFKRAGFSARDTYNVTEAGELAKMLVTLVPGDMLYLKADESGAFNGLKYAISPRETLVITPADDAGTMVADIDTKEVETRYNFAQGEIDSSFWKAGVTAGLTNNQIMNLAALFGWDIDFAMEIRQGDSFNMVFEEHYIDGEFVGFGDIVAAEFTNQGEKFTAIQYTDGNYYTAEGRSMRKSFLRAPINFKYVSSNFTGKRFHPVQKRWKSHNGTDYVAAVGTPVMASGDGRVVQSSYNRFNGNYVFIQHGEKYVTKYLHFKKRAVKAGEVVKQGQVIGYLGSTGMATGPHLHYEFLVNGTHRNPRTVELPKAAPIEASQRAAFMELAQNRLTQLSNNRRIMLAMQ